MPPKLVLFWAEAAIGTSLRTEHLLGAVTGVTDETTGEPFLMDTWDLGWWPGLSVKPSCPAAPWDDGDR